ncbi:MAG: hypothetical protein CVV64_18540 [Candidatus Wallbacteria bacterium HGW-Wallbacteria-1]|jgi:Tat protein secretion system quality control protein TatD with DNase activity|uniref:Uncharacterized protein n=1 Tax=Candidatus Wallbacteria bacterium HGW-Wallbacteria-1 TaxID=2013854 RepID=A0A2N1PJI6_9BACT|nr:MAG: hypothetical protein CVV64_18540 [Candidatus Wallbacteria bacterium HGW-Wallbacteria-1]
MITADAHNHSHLSVSLRDCLEHASETKVELSLVNSCGPADWAVLRDFAKCSRNCEVVPFFGIHPWHTGQGDSWRRELELLHETIKNALKQSLKCGIGETGIHNTGNRKHSPGNLSRNNSGTVQNLDIQTEVFRFHVQLSARYNLPMSIHCVRGWEILLRELTEIRAARFMIHGFRGSWNIMQRVLRLNGWLSFGKDLVDKRESIRNAASDALTAAPRERVLIESDWESGENGSYSDLFTAVLSRSAELRGMTLNDAAELNLVNCRTFTESGEASHVRKNY